MDKKTKGKKIYVTSHTLKSANNKVASDRTCGKAFVGRHSSAGKFVTRDELKDAFKTASRKLKSA